MGLSEGVEAVSATPPVTTTEAPKEAVVETKAPEAKPVEDAKLSELLKKEKMLFRNRQVLSHKAQAMEAKEKALAEREAKLAAAQTNPIEALKLLGWTHDQVNQYVLNNQQTPPDKHVSDIKNEIEALKRQAVEDKKTAALQAKAQAEAEVKEVIDNFKVSVNEFIDANKDTYELVHLHDAQDIVFATIETHFNNTKKVLSTKEATELVEKYLEDQIDKSTKTKKLASRYQVPQPTDKKVDKSAMPSNEPRTLTNAMNTGASPGMLPAKNENDRIQRALAALDGKR